MLAEDPDSVRVPKLNDSRWANAFVDELMSEFSPEAKFGVTPEVDVDRFEEGDAIVRPAQVYIYKTDPEESTNGWSRFASGLTGARLSLSTTAGRSRSTPSLKTGSCLGASSRCTSGKASRSGGRCARGGASGSASARRWPLSRSPRT